MSQSRIAEILDGLYFEARTQRGKGTAFERLVRQFLLTDPRYAERFDEVWMWSDWPGRGARPDHGIDLVARERETDELCAVQCKFYDPQTGVITKNDVDSFLAESGTGEFTSRLFVSTTERWNSAAEETVTRQAVPVSRVGLEDLFNSTIDWDSFSLETPEVMVRTGGKSLREHLMISATAFKAQDYLLGSRSGLDWLLDRYRVSTHKASGIINDPNDWMADGAGGGPTAPAQPRYLLDLIARVTTVSVRTQRIVNSLPQLSVRR